MSVAFGIGILDFRSNHLFFPVLDQSPIYNGPGSVYGLLKSVLKEEVVICLKFERFRGSLYSFWSRR